MNPENDIVIELQELQSVLAGMPRTMPYAVPEDYFSTFSVQSIISDVDPVLDLPKTTPFQVPEGYFASISLKEIMADADPVLDLPKTMPFVVPQGYFEDFESNILSRVEVPVFGKVNAGFDAPAGYFDGFADRMLAVAKASERSVELEEDIIETKIIAFRPQWKSVRWAAAAMLVLSIGIGSFMKFGGSTVAPSASKQLAQLDKGLIRSYVQQHIDEFDTEMLAENNPVLMKSAEENINKLKGKDIQEYLEDDDLGDSGTN